MLINQRPSNMLDFLKRFWNKETSNVTAAALVIGFASLASRLVGMLRDRLLASTFGAGDMLDAYYAAFRLPDLFYQLIVLGALSAGFIPVFAEYLERRGHDEAWKLAEKVFSTILVILVLACGALALTSSFFVPQTVPGFTGEKLALTVTLTRILLISTVTLGLSAVMGGVLQATRRFVAFSLAPVLYNIGIIIGIIFLAPKFGVMGVAWGVAIGAFLHFIVQAVVAVPMGFQRLRWPSFSDPGVRRILTLMIPRITGLAASQINLVILLGFASTLESGSVAVFNLANNLQYVPIGLIGISFAVAAFPTFSQLAANKDLENFKASFLATTRKILFLVIPATVLMLLLRIQIIRIVLGSGQFDWSATIRTADVLSIFVLSLAAQSMIPLLARAFYALQDTKTPLYIALVALAVNATLAYFLRQQIGIAGLAVAFTVDSFIQAGLLWLFLRKRFGHLAGKELGISISKTILASIALFGFGWLARQYVGTIFPLRTFWQVALQAGAAIVVGGSAFCGLALLLGVQEFSEFIQAAKSKIYKRIKVGEGAEGARGV
ncbi:MAG: murein biosynthesis integral membrane protein MurJ [Patescibacteria group bacterium]